MHPTITALYTGLLGLIFLGLSLRVIYFRMRLKINLGDGENPQVTRAIRVHANFTEYVPLLLGMLLLAELSGIQERWLHLFGGALVLSRLLHAWGLSGYAGVSVGRFAGTALTLFLLGFGSFLCLMAGLMQFVHLSY